MMSGGPGEIGEPASLPKASVIIPVYNDRERLRRCLKSLLQQSYRGPVEIIVVDNGSDDGSGDLAGKFPDVAFLSEKRPGSYIARNTGIEHATGVILAFTDSDCEPDSDWLAAIVATILQAKNVGFVGGDVRIRTSGANADVGELYDFVTGLRQQYYVEHLHFAATANMATTREVIARIGAFKETLRSGGDRDWGQRVFAAGYRCIFDAGAIVDHPARDKAAIIKKTRRTIAGARQIAPRRFWGIRQFIEAVLPPFSAVPDLWGPKGKSLTPWQVIRVFMFAWRVRFLQAIMTIRYHATSFDAPRS